MWKCLLEGVVPETLKCCDESRHDRQVEGPARGRSARDDLQRKAVHQAGEWKCLLEGVVLGT